MKNLKKLVKDYNWLLNKAASIVEEYAKLKGDVGADVDRYSFQGMNDDCFCHRYTYVALGDYEVFHLTLSTSLLSLEGEELTSALKVVVETQREIEEKDRAEALKTRNERIEANEKEWYEKLKEKYGTNT